MTTDMISVPDLLSENSAFGTMEIQTFGELLGGSQLTEVRQHLNSLCAKANEPGASEKLLTKAGICCYTYSRHNDANKILGRVSSDPLGLYYHGLTLISLEDFTAAAEKFTAAENAGYDRVDCELQRAGAIRAGGDVEAAEATLQAIARDAASRAEYSYQVGCIWADRGDALTAVEYFERAVDMDPHHSRALFQLASANALRGNDNEAIRLYEQSLSKPPFYMGALLNLGLLYEDKENYPSAAFCFRRVLEHDPNNFRARMYLKDIEATDDMYYDEDSARNEARMQQLLARPVTDFELSVRSRNCLAAMDIKTLGDLTEISEQELLAGKNFGETSLHEIREMLGAHGLSIGENLHKIAAREPVFEQNLTPEEQALMNKPVTELNVSVRARKCMVRLGIQTIGQLVQRTGDELLSSRNFGVTSLNEIRQRLNEMGLSLRND